MADYGRGLKAGLLTGIVYGIIWSLIIWLGLPTLLGLPLSNPAIQALWAMIALPLFAEELIWCIILGLIVGLIVGLLAGSMPKSPVATGIIAGIIFWIILFVSDFVLLSGISAVWGTIGLFTVFEFVITVVVFGVLFGIFWSVFGKK